MENLTKCETLVRQAYRRRMEQVRKLWNLYKKDPELDDDEYGNWTEYGLSFDYVPKGTFKDQKRGYFRFQISYGGPSEEFRFYADPELQLTSVEFWYLDWFDGAKVNVTGKNLKLLEEVFTDYRESGILEHLIRNANGV